MLTEEVFCVLVLSYLKVGKVNNSKRKNGSSSVLRGWYPSGLDFSEIDKITEGGVKIIKAGKKY